MIVTAPGPADAQPLPYRGGTVVALGDSRAAGAFDSLAPGSIGGCGRSPANYPARSGALLGAARTVNVACGGAKSAHIWRDVQFTGRIPNPVQLSQVPANARVITVATGHNDLEWSTLRARCLRRTPQQKRDRECRTKSANIRFANRHLYIMRREVTLALRKIRQHAPNAQIIVLGPGGIVGERACRGHYPMSHADAAWIHGVFDRADAITARAAKRVNASYVDMQQYANTHGVCSGRQAWFAGERGAGDSLPYHMNRAGMRAISRMVAGAVQR